MNSRPPLSLLRVARSTSPNIAHLMSHIAQKRTLLHKLRKKYRPKPEIWALNAFLLTNFIAQRFKISPKFPIWAMKSPIWPPCRYYRTKLQHNWDFLKPHFDVIVHFFKRRKQCRRGDVRQRKHRKRNT